MTIELCNLVQWNVTDDSGQILPPGVYFMEFNSDDLSLTKKLIKLK